MYHQPYSGQGPPSVYHPGYRYGGPGPAPSFDMGFPSDNIPSLMQLQIPPELSASVSSNSPNIPPSESSAAGKKEIAQTSLKRSSSNKSLTNSAKSSPSHQKSSSSAESGRKTPTSDKKLSKSSSVTKPGSSSKLKVDKGEDAKLSTKDERKLKGEIKQKASTESKLAKRTRRQSESGACSSESRLKSVGELRSRPDESGSIADEEGQQRTASESSGGSSQKKPPVQGGEEPQEKEPELILNIKTDPDAPFPAINKSCEKSKLVGSRWPSICSVACILLIAVHHLSIPSTRFFIDFILILLGLFSWNLTIFCKLII